MAITSSIAPVADPVYVDPAASNDLGDKDIFLKLLVAQMEYQDPMDPQDATQLSSQLAQYNAVEQQIQTNDLLQQLVDNSGTGSSSSSIPTGAGTDYLGHPVTVSDNNILYDGTAQNFDIVLDNNASDALAFIYDANGNPVRTLTLSNLGAGANNITWDGLTDSGATATQGNYTIEVSAADVSGNEVAASIQRSGMVDAVRFTSTGTELVVGGVATSADAVTEIRL